MTVDQMMILVKALAIVLGVLYAMIIKPAIDNYVGKEKINEFLGYVKVAIRCAEQIYTPEEWAKKKNYVYHYAIDKAEEYGLKLTEQDIDIIIEGFVNEIKKG